LGTVRFRRLPRRHSALRRRRDGQPDIPSSRTWVAGRSAACRPAPRTTRWTGRAAGRRTTSAPRPRTPSVWASAWEDARVRPRRPDVPRDALPPAVVSPSCRSTDI